jgi:hypothetical protein
MRRGRKPSPNPTPEQLRQREQYKSRRAKLLRIRRARGLELAPQNQYTILPENADRIHLIDEPIRHTSISWEHISSGRSNS